ncbi:alpha/beta hydrolase-fold protein [Corynebacterium mucifaciens]|uniref:Diacylglycerol O-acyltransferase/trehalose O-mycolyltransferase n=1 Tax=Corynebacterium mucifaciens TaxID=57171 RepID=A0A7X6LRQ4_9CORY|nr:esterase family protein [Corynebacterium mucifaciens]
MKLRRPAIAVAAAALVAAGSVPSVTHAAQIDETAPNAGQTVAATDSPSRADNVEPLDEAPKTTNGQDQKWVGILENNQQLWPNEAVRVHSESMGRDIPVALFRATDENGQPVQGAPTVYLLNGAGGSEQNTDWVAQAFDKMYETYGRAGVNVVVPMEGAFSYYVDWAEEPPVENTYYKGKQMWSTFLAEELTGAVEPHLGANGRRAVAGLSMAATSSLLLAEHYPEKYDAVGSFSGCAATSTPVPWKFVDLTVSRAAPGVMTPEYIFGKRGSEENRSKDALVNAGALKGTAVYISNGTGLAGEGDMAGTLKEGLIKAGNDPAVASVVAGSNALTLQVEGGAIEAATNACTHDLLVKLAAEGVEVGHAELRNVGTHSWGTWRDDLQLSYDTVFKKALNPEL